MGTVTDIQRFTLNDGPGIRTTVFFKGCNLSCAWCHNPETLAMQPEVLRYPDRCIGCGACVGFGGETCGLPPKLTECTVTMAAECFPGALTAAGREMSADEVLAEVRQDISYYETSGGGVTLSGGEALMQPDFARDVLELCAGEKIPAAVETNLAYPFERLEKLLGLLSLVMADIKLLDDEAHKKWTGVGNAQIIENARLLARSGTPFILRTPVIPGVNDTREEIAAIASFVKSLGGNLMYYELLNFNPLGASKYEAMQRKNSLRDARPLSGERMAALKAAAVAAGIPVRMG